MASHKAARCTATPAGHIVKKELESSYKIHGAAVVACYASCSNNPKFSFPTCKDQLAHGANGIHCMQRYFSVFLVLSSLIVFLANLMLTIFLFSTISMQMVASRTMELGCTLPSCT